MKPHDSVCTVVDTVQLPTAVTSYLESSKDDDGNDYIKGGMLQSSQHAWLSNSSNLTVINVSNGQKIAAWTYGTALRDFKPRITCVAELPTPLVEQTIQLLIGLECDMIGGMVCLFHCNGSRIVRAIQVDRKVVCMQYIDDLHGTALGCFDGAVLIGTDGGGAFIFDLNRYVCTEAIMNTTRDNTISIKDEFNIANLVVLSIDNINIITEQRKIAFKKDHHIAIQINEGCVNGSQFILHNPDNTVKLCTDRDNIFVTSTLYVPQLASAIVGFNIGVFQLWNLLTLELEFTSQLTDDRLPITHIGFMEPCDDPRAFCYIWAIHSTTDRHDEGFPLAAMYSLTYHEKKNYNEQEFLYKNFLTCNLRFNIELSNVDGVSSMGKQLIGGRSLVCHTLSKTANKEDADEYVLNLCQIVWECWTTSAIAPVQSVMLIFDIDQWYKDHMPDSSILQTNNFMCVVNLGDTFAPTSNSYLCDVKINHETLTSYCSVQRLEEHFYPNSIGYECSCLTNLGITKLLTMGVQRQLLASINKIGPSILLHPTKLFNQCLNTGLIPLYVDPPPTINSSEQIQRQTLLSIALEARLVQFLGKCAYEWATGSHTSTGCTLQLILEWSWSRASSLKENGDLITIPFFDLSGGIPDRNSVQHLNNCVRQLGHLGTLYNIILDKCSKYLLPKNITDIKKRQKIIQMITQYFQVIQWFLNVGLLPEFRFDQMAATSNDKLPYPIESLIKFYQNRRLKLHCLSGENPANEELRNKCCKLLFIDELMNMECSEMKLKGLWMEDDSNINGLYPPPSLHSLLKVYLIPEIKEEYKHSLVLYMLIDYAMMFDDERYENVIRRLMQFPTMFGLSNTAIKVTQAFWHLDHRDFELALNQLQWVLTGGCLTQWQHNVVLSALLIQKKTQAALQYLHVRKPCMSLSSNIKDLGNDVNTVFDDWETCSNIYLSRGLVYEAFNLHRDSMKDCPPSACKERLKIFFEGCKKMGFLTKVLVLPLTQFEESVLVQFLKSIDDSHSNDILVLYYLRRSRYIEAQQINEQLKRLTSKGQLPYDATSSFSMRKEHVHKTETRDQLVDLYYKSLPPITRQLAYVASVNTFNRKRVQPTPFTVNVQSNEAKSALYKSSYIQATIEKASEIWLTKPEVVRGIKRSFKIEETPFLCTPKLTKISSRFAFDEKMSTTPDETASKYRKLNDGSKMDISFEKEDGEEEVISPKLQKEIDVLLRTPLVERKSTWSVPSSIDTRFSTERSSMGREATPRSILKIRQLRGRMVSSPIEERFLVETDDELDQKSDTLSRSIRFNIPSGENSPSPTSEYASDVQDSFSELCNYTKIAEPRSVILQNPEFTPSPRKSIHNESINIDTERSELVERENTIVESSPSPILTENDDRSETDNASTITRNSTRLNDFVDDDDDDDLSNGRINASSIVINSPKPRRSYRLSNISYQKLNESKRNSPKTIITNDIPESNKSISRGYDNNSIINDRFIPKNSPLITRHDVSIQQSFTKLNASKLGSSISETLDYTESKISFKYTSSIRDNTIPVIDDSILSEPSEQMVSDSSINISQEIIDDPLDKASPEKIPSEANVEIKERSPSPIVEEMAEDKISEDEMETEQTNIEVSMPSSTLNVINASSEDVKNPLENVDHFSDESNQGMLYLEDDILNNQSESENKLDDELFEENLEISEQISDDENKLIHENDNVTLANNESLEKNEISSVVDDHSTILDKSVDANENQTLSIDESMADDKNSSFVTCEDVSINNEDQLIESENESSIDNNLIDDECKDQTTYVNDNDQTLKATESTPTKTSAACENDEDSSEEDNLNLVIDTSVCDDNANETEEEMDAAITTIDNNKSMISKLSKSNIQHNVSEVKDKTVQNVDVTKTADVSVVKDKTVQNMDVTKTADVSEVKDKTVQNMDVTKTADVSEVKDKTVQNVDVTKTADVSVVKDKTVQNMDVTKTADVSEVKDKTVQNMDVTKTANVSEVIDKIEQDVDVTKTADVSEVIDKIEQDVDVTKTADVSEVIDEIEQDVDVTKTADVSEVIDEIEQDVDVTKTADVSEVIDEIEQDVDVTKTADVSEVIDKIEQNVEMLTKTADVSLDLEMSPDSSTNVVKLESSPSRVMRSPRSEIRAKHRSSISPLPKTESDINSEANSLDASSEITASESSTLLSARRSRRKSKSDTASRRSISSNKSIDNSFNDDDSRISTSNRLTRSASKLDNSIMSESSVDSDKESASMRRKSRRSIFGLTKPNLSVIPEMSHTEDEKSTTNISRSSQNISNVLDELSSRRMTRHQRSLLEKSLEVSKSAIPVIMEEDSENSLHIDENAKDSDDSDGDSVSICSNTTTRTMDPILLLDKKSFEGPPDLEEEQANLNTSRASSVLSDVYATPDKKSKLKRAVSEPRTLKRLKNSLDLSFESPTRLLRSAKKTDSTSEVLNDSIVDSPGSRLRRQSFHKAIEALNTPKRNRRLSTDSKASDSGQSLIANVSERTGPPSLKESVIEPTVPRSTRRTKAASIHGNTTISNLDESESKIIRNRARKSLIATSLSKEEISALNSDKVSHYRKKIGVHRVSHPLQFDVKKK